MRTSLICVALSLGVVGCISWEDELQAYCDDGGGGCADAGAASDGGADAGTDGGQPTLEVASGADQSSPAGRPFENDLAVRALDEGGQPLPDVEITATCPSQEPSCSFDGSPTATATTGGDGVAWFSSLRAGDDPGSYAVVLTAAGFPATELTFTNLPPVAETIVLAGAPANQAEVDQLFPDPFVFRVAGSNGAPFTGATVRFSLSATSPGGSFAASGTNTLEQDTDGTGTVGTGVIRANRLAGEGSLTATVLAEDGSETDVTTSVPLALVPGPPTEVVIVSGDGQVTAAGAPLLDALVVRVEDTFDNPIPDEDVIFSNGNSGQHCVFGNGSTDASSRTDANGEASVVCSTVDVGGGFTVSVWVADTPPVSTSFTVEALIPTELVSFAGNNQTTSPDQPFDAPLVVQVMSNGTAVPNATVTFAAPGSPAPGTFEDGSSLLEVVSDAEGMATSSLFTPKFTGPVDVHATEPHILNAGGSAVVFTLTAE